MTSSSNSKTLKRSDSHDHDQYWGKYISKQGAANLKHYQYSGSDASYFYNYISNPHIYPWCLEHIPLWMAPNLITLLGLMCTILTYSITVMWYCPKLEGEAPAWVYVLNGVMLFR
jgi:ethanolaminephosphotransferase